MTHTTTTTSASHARVMGNGNKKFTSQSPIVDNLSKHSLQSTNNKDVAKWSSDDVQDWIKRQCKIYELKKTVVAKFEMNGQALMLLSKQDFIRRSPDGGEILYYALQHLINPNKVNSARLGQSLSRGGSSDQHPRIVEISEDNDEFTSAVDSSSPKPIVEEPDDPPIIRRSQSDPNHSNYQQRQTPLLFFHQAHIRPAVVTMSAGSAAAYFHQQQQRFPNTFMHAQHHTHLHTHQPFIFQSHLLHQYHPMMSARGILIEIMDDTDVNNNTPEGVNGPINGTQGSLYMVTMNGQRYIMNEGQVKQLVTEVYQRQALQDLQRQHIQQQYFQLQQQHLQQQQQHFQQQQHQQQHFQQQPQQQQQQQSQQQQQQRF